MNQTDIKQSAEWFSMMNEYYVENVGGASVFVFKLDKTITKIDPLYGEEIKGRIYLRPFQIKALHLVNPFEFMFQDNLIGEVEGNTKSFNFNFNDMVKKLYTLKNEPMSKLYISGNGTWEIEKKTDKIYLYKDKLIEDTLPVSIFQTISSIRDRLNTHMDLDVILEGEDDFTRNLPNFPRTEFSNSQLLLKTYNQEYKNCSDIVENGDLILVEEQMRLYEVVSAQPAGNFGWKYQMWNVKCDVAYPYVEFSKLKSQVYGIKNDRIQVQ
jgi:hypothetical protein